MEKRPVPTGHHSYTIDSSQAPSALILTWDAEPGLPARDFGSGIAEFAGRCVVERPVKAVIDARQLDQTSEAFAWLRGQVEVTDLEPYDKWWLEEIVPRYHEAGIIRFAVATGDPSAPGEIPAPPDVNFKVGYFPDLEEALAW